MLRESSLAFGYDLDERSVADPAVPSGIPGGDALLRFVDAVLGVSNRSVATAQQTLVVELGPEAATDAASVFGNFQMMNRVAEATGIPVSGAAIDTEAATIESLGLTRFLKP